MSLEPLLQHVVPFFLVLTRLSGLFLITPVLSSTMVPRNIKVLLLVALALAVYPMTPAWAMPANLTIVGLVPMVVGELLVGFSIGLIAAIPMYAAEMGGIIIGQQMGFGLAKVYNPEFDAEVDILGQLLFFIIFASYLAMGGFTQVFSALVATFERVGPGGIALSQSPVQLIVSVLASGVELAMRMALPVIAAILLMLVMFAVITKTMPAINIMSVGFTAQVLAGLFVLLLALPAIAGVAAEETSEIMRQIDDWSRSLGEQPGRGV
mgnify:CR=1 FL=1